MLPHRVQTVRAFVPDRISTFRIFCLTWYRESLYVASSCTDSSYICASQYIDGSYMFPRGIPTVRTCVFTRQRQSVHVRHTGDRQSLFPRRISKVFIPFLTRYRQSVYVCLTGYQWSLNVASPGSDGHCMLPHQVAKVLTCCLIGYRQ
jgi:hypothetical protein